MNNGYVIGDCLMQSGYDGYIKSVCWAYSGCIMGVLSVYSGRIMSVS